MDAEAYKALRPTIPTNPGIYKYFDKEGNLLYVGKAKNLRNRVSSYFANKKFEGAKLKMLVRQIDHIEFTVVNSEQDALLLENGLIKEHQPKYNIQLRDDKSYPFICIKKEPFPRVFLTRNAVNDGSQYLGPFTSVKRVRYILRTAQQLFPLRTCKLNLTQENIEAKKFKVCLEYHIENCLGPCEGLQSEEDYLKGLDQVKNILNGKTHLVQEHLRSEMDSCIEALEFEKAERVKKKLERLKDYQSKSVIVNSKLNNVDVYSILEFSSRFFLNYMRVSNGTIIETRNINVKQSLEESIEDVLIAAISEYSVRSNYRPEEIITPMEVEVPFEEITITVPKIGDKKKLLDLSEKNALASYNEFLTKQSALAEKQVPFAVKSLKEDLQLKELPRWIECFDNSNFQGSFPVASMVVFKNGKPLKSAYRHYNIKTVEGPNDFASMEEIVYRRYSRLMEEEKPLPNLIIIDGGKGQLSSARKSLEKLGLESEIPIIGIAKRLEEIFTPGDQIPLYLNKKSESLKLIQQLRDEAHRFAITFHRQKRSKAFTKSELTDIPGIGKKTAEALLKKHGSIKRLKQVPLEDLALDIGQSRAKALIEYFGKSD